MLEKENASIQLFGDMSLRPQAYDFYPEDLDCIINDKVSIAYDMNQDSKLFETLQQEAYSGNTIINPKSGSPKYSPNGEDTPKKSEVKKKVGRKPLGFTKRKDVVFKSMLRQIRNYFWTGLNEHTKYQVRKRKSRADESFYYDCLKEYISKALKMKVSDHIILLVGSFASPRDMEALIKKDPYKIYPKSKIEKCRSIHNTLYCFNQNRFEKEMLESIDMCQLILNYFNRPDYHPKDNDERRIRDEICKK